MNTARFEKLRSRAAAWLMVLCWVASAGCLFAAEPNQVLEIWPGLAPGESTASMGTALPSRAGETPPATRITNITRPQLEMYAPPVDADRAPMPAVLIFPGGGYNYVVVDKEGAEPAAWLNSLGVTAFVVRYRTKNGSTDRPLWQRPLEDGQRAVSLVRSRAAEWNLDPGRIGVLGFSAGGQAAAVVSTRFEERAYAPLDEVDRISCRPDFSLLVYPAWLVDQNSAVLSEFLPISAHTPPACLIHAHDDGITSLSSVAYYTALKQQQVAAELHVYAAGGHGYGVRPVAGTNIHTWPDRAADWLRQQGLIVAE